MSPFPFLIISILSSARLITLDGCGRIMPPSIIKINRLAEILLDHGQSPSVSPFSVFTLVLIMGSQVPETSARQICCRVPLIPVVDRLGKIIFGTRRDASEWCSARQKPFHGFVGVIRHLGVFADMFQIGTDKT